MMMFVFVDVVVAFIVVVVATVAAALVVAEIIPRAKAFDHTGHFLAHRTFCLFLIVKT